MITLNDELVSSRGQTVVETAEVTVTMLVDDAGQLVSDAGQLTIVDSKVV
ncbi:MAG TPA: hypothetical protein VHV10_00845 [Ktedonobacteraceae bacterium]|nr:hypothetical protein [Ktedonobacteraceae bacterium]